MKQTTIKKFGKPIHLIYAGDCYISKNDEIIGTILGSCISLCLYDSLQGIGGMNHFMLPGKINSVDMHSKDSTKYGIAAINQLLHGMYDLGAQKKHIKAKLFGGGAVLELEKKVTAIPSNNIRVARLIMEVEDIPIVEEDTGGKFIRKVYLDVKSGDVFLKKILKNNFIDDLE